WRRPRKSCRCRPRPSNASGLRQKPGCSGKYGSRRRMNPERWRRIKEILDVSLGLAPPERDEYLKRVCESDVDLRQEVESLIQADDAAGDLFEAGAAPAPSDPMIGARLGAYRVVESIGSGGMGSVYRAVRADDAFQKEVAIKVVHRGLDLERVVRQF